MLYREIIAVCSEIHTKHINTLCGQNVEFMNVKPGFFLKFFLYFSVQLHSLLHSNLNTTVPLTNCYDALLQNFLPSCFLLGCPTS
jgi:hypothetical protein